MFFKKDFAKNGFEGLISNVDLGLFGNSERLAGNDTLSSTSLIV